MKCSVLSKPASTSEVSQSKRGGTMLLIWKLTVAAVGFTLSVNAAGAQKRKVAVLDFGYATVRTSVQAYFGTDQDIGRGISDMLIGELIRGADYRVIERSALDKIIKEQNFSNTDRADPVTAAKIGGLLGVDAVIIGDITAFGNDDKSYGTEGGGGIWGKTIGIGGMKLNKNKSIVEISARMVDVNSAEILAAVDGRGEAKKTGIGLGGAGATQGGGGAAVLTMTSSNFAQSEIGKVIKMAVAELATNLDSKAGSLPEPSKAALPPFLALVADVTQGELVINAGTKSGVKVGDTLIVSHVDRVINDPATGKPLRTKESAVGTLRLNSVDADSAVGTFSGPGVPVVGDRVKQREDP